MRHRRHDGALLWGVALLAAAVHGCGGACGASSRGGPDAGAAANRPAPAQAAPRSFEPPGPGPVAAFPEAHRAAYREALRRARVWLDALTVDPFELREQNIKGKKKLVEQLDAYYRLYQVAPKADREALLARVRQVVAVTRQDRYHDMGALDDRSFKQDATSYLRAALLMERLGLDTTRYREEIAKIHPRLDGHMPRRGPHQRRVFHWYYAHFGLEEPFPLGTALEDGVIARRLDPATMTWNQAYELTHEVYALYEYGDRLDVDPFTPGEKQYLKGTLEALVRRFLRERNIDLLAEVVECLHYLRFTDVPAYRAGVLAVLEAQNDDGSWGRYPAAEARLGDYVKQGLLLHTTLVAIGALTAVFDKPLPPPGNRDAGT